MGKKHSQRGHIHSMKIHKIHPSLSPFIGLSFLVVAVTGILLFFHIKNGPIVVMREWLGMAFLLAGIIHMFAHLPQMLAYLRKPSCIASVALALVMAIMLVFVGLNHHNGPHGSHENRAPTTEG